MAYFAPYIDATGLHVPVYSDIRDNILQQFQSIYGQTVYLEPDGADYQMISVIALKLNDAFQGMQLAYNSRSPLTAIGSDLDSIVKLNGLVRKSASASTCLVVIGGTAGTVINNGVVQDVNRISWDLPVQVTIPSGGTISVTVTCETPGAITANPGDISIISTPTAGWTSVSNTVAAVAGQPIEADSQLRARQGLSVALPSLTMLAGTLAAIAATTGVTRYNTGMPTPGGPGSSIENPTGATDSWGNPPHSISMVVEGGTDLDVATAIYNKRGIGCFTNGTTSVLITDPNNANQLEISFFRPSYVPIFVAIQIHPLTGYTSSMQTAIQQAVTSYLNSLQIGESVTVSALYGPALSVMPNLSLPNFSIRSLTAGTSSGSLSTTDISILFNQVAQGVLANVTITTV